MKATIVKLLLAFVMVGTMAGCASFGGPSAEQLDALSHPENYAY